ncbi:calcium incorporation protein MxaA [Variovorax paradoxus]|jgi:mxaA protein|uniref:calcium incorporation protein MxaA n=1 Tax=Variovorax paradoxus TaxID=34073 RepID=UPI0029C6AB43|nr:calcium incorporation protein MxaA [Variovorax paradoxus]WPH18503.1 calcium incorporation protein MxaA [Variovorax paradoxus]
MSATGPVHAAVLALVLAALPGGFSHAADPAAPAAAAAAAATIEQPRSFGHVLGDVLTQRVLLEHQGRPLEPGVLPAAARIDLWLERRPSRIETDAQGRRWLAIEYQLINAPRALTAISLPALTIATASGPALALPAWPVSIGPLTPVEAFGQGDLQPLRPDRPVAALATHPIEQHLKLSLLALLAVLLAWLSWWAWRNMREAQQLPFAHAWRELKRIDDPASPEAWRVLHRALNRSAGRVVHGASLPQLLADAPYLRPLQPRLEDFYRESTRRFFFAESAAAPVQPLAAYPLKPLCRALRNAEKHHRH